MRVFDPQDHHSPVSDDEVWVYENSNGWYWRADYIGSGPFKTEAEAQDASVKFFEEEGEVISE